MRRLRLAMVALAIAISIPVALLIALALQSVAFEESSRHQTLAARAFDEMERALSRFLEEEEARPIEQYSYFVRSRDASVPARSPLSRPSPHPFVIGYFEIDTLGRLHTPFRPRPGEAAAAAPLQGSTLQAIRTLEELVPGALPGRQQSEAAKKFSERGSNFGTTIALEEPVRPLAPLARVAERLDDLFLQSGEEPALQTSPEVPSARTDSLASAVDATESSPATPTRDLDAPSLDEALESLNVGQKLREQRVQKRSRESDDAAPVDRRPDALAESKIKAESVPGGKDLDDPSTRSMRASDTADLKHDTPTPADPRTMNRRDLARDEPPRQRGDSATTPTPKRARSVDSRTAAIRMIERPSQLADGTVKEAGEAPSSRLATPKPDRTARPARRGQRIEIDPMVGHAAGEGHLVLSRTVLVGDKGYRQGLLIDRRKLAVWLDDQVIADSRLGEVAALRFGNSEERYRSLDISPRYLYRHHFAEPFSALQATLSLKPLAAVASTRNIYLLSLLLAVVAAGGLFAVYRMIAVVVRYAEKRNSFVSAVSHELKTPLTAIRMHGEMLRDGLVSSEEKRNEYYRTIHDESERLGRLINNVLEFSQLERGQRELHLMVGSLAEVVRDVVANLGPHAERQGFRLSARIDDDLPAVCFDRDALVQVLFNLTDNAMKYARGAGPQSIEIDCHRADEGGRRSPQGDRVVLEVRDFGPGVPRRHLSHVFEPFYRAAADDEVAKGTGIGLALVRDLCQAMGAAVAADNVASGGFRVWVAFRAADV